MEAPLEKINKQYPDGKITKIEFGQDYKTCYLDFVPHTDNKKDELVLRLTFTSCVQFKFSGLDYQFGKRHQNFLSVIAWGINTNGDYINRFLEGIKDEPIATSQKRSEIAKNLKHFYFQGFEANIDIIASRLEIKEGESGV